MFQSCLVSLALALAPAPHTPHDSCHSLAAARLTDGRIVLLALDYDGRTLVSWDEGASWSGLPGPTPAGGHGWDLAWHPGLTLPGGATGAFLVAQEEGLRAWDPVTGVVHDFSGDLAPGDHFVLDVEAPRSGDGPALLVTEGGQVFLLDPATLRLRRVLDTGFTARRRVARVAVTPGFRSGSLPGPEQAMAAAIQGVLYLSVDGGSTWARHWQFWSPSSGNGGWEIQAIAFADDFPASGILLLGRGRLAPQGGTEGEILRSDDGGGSFVQVRATGSAVAALLATPVGPGGRRVFLAACRDFPAPPEQAGEGILRSEDGGLTWDDEGNGQDFLRELAPTDRSGWKAAVEEQELALHPDWLEGGGVFYARQQGVWRSDDEGRHWLPLRMRTEREVRDVEAVLDAGGSRLVFATSYGGALSVYDLDKGAAASLGEGSPDRYGRRLAVSPAYPQDGTVAVTDSATLGLWYDPRLPPANPFQARGWVRPPARSPVGDFLSQDARTVAFAPDYGPGGSQTLFWASWSRDGVIRSTDGARTGEVLDLLAGGGRLGEVESVEPTPAYDPANGGSGLYAASGTRLYRLRDGLWELVADLGHKIERLAVDPGFDAAVRPRVFATVETPPHVFEVLDTPAGVSVRSLDEGLGDVMAKDLDFHPAFAAGTEVLYLAGMGSGVWRRDLAAPGSLWEPLGTGLSGAWVKAVSILPGSSPPLVAIGTTDGVWWLEDAPGAAWRTSPGVWCRDDSDTTIATFAPGDPANPRPDRVWPWRFVNREHIPGHRFTPTGPGVLLATWDGSWLETVGVAREWTFVTRKGPQDGELRLEAWSYPDRGQLLASTVQDLHAPIQARTHVRLQLPAAQPVWFRAEARLDPGEELLFDALQLRD